MDVPFVPAVRYTFGAVGKQPSRSTFSKSTKGTSVDILPSAPVRILSRGALPETNRGRFYAKSIFS